MRYSIVLLLSFWLFSFGAQANDGTPDDFAMAEALIRHEVSTPGTYLFSNSRGFRYFVSVQDSDLPADAILRLQDLGLTILPGSLWKDPAPGTLVGPDMHMSIRELSRLPDGTYEVHHNYGCGSLCGSGNTAIMSRDSDGWYVLSSTLHKIR